MAPERPRPTEYAPAFGTYIAAVPDGDIVELLEKQLELVGDLAKQVPEDRETFRYGPDKWTIREVFGHLSDAERVFGYRFVSISRGDAASLPGFDENVYVAAANFNARPLQALANEFALLRRSNLMEMRALDPDAWQRTGLSNNKPVSVRAIAYVMAGHVNHHIAILRARYGL